MNAGYPVFDRTHIRERNARACRWRRGGTAWVQNNADSPVGATGEGVFVVDRRDRVPQGRAQAGQEGLPASSGLPRTAGGARGRLVRQLIEMLTVHTYLENEVMYPRVRELLPDLEDDVLESYEEHHVADVLCFELATMSPDDERFDAKTTVLIESRTHHIDEEEQDWFPKVRTAWAARRCRRSGRRWWSCARRTPEPGPAERVEESHRRHHRLTQRCGRR